MRLSILFLMLPTVLGAGEKKKPSGPFGKKITISKETTFVSGPVDAEGNIDYVAALNDRLGKAVDPKDNVVVALWQIFGPKPEGAEMPDRFYKRLGIDRLPEKGDYFAHFYPYLKKHVEIDPTTDINKALDDLDQTRIAPWKAKDYPHIAGWLTINKPHLDRTVAGLKRPRYYSPLIPNGQDDANPPLATAILPGVQQCRNLATALICRAMLHLGEGRRDAAWQDILACHRLGRHLSHGASAIEGLVGIAIEHIAYGAELIYLEEARLDAVQLEACRRDLAALPSRSPIAEQVDWCERLMFIDAVAYARRNGKSSPAVLFPDTPIPEEIDIDAVLKDLDWDVVLRSGNRHFDRLTAAMRLKSRPARVEALDRANQDVLIRREKLANPLELGRALADPERKAVVVGDVLISLIAPATRKLQAASDRAEQIGQNLTLAFALAAYRVKEGSYPKKLDALAPKYIAAVPLDLFSGKALIYRPSGDGYLLYSVGLNGEDDGGRSYDDEPAGDDIRVLLPRAK